MKTSFAKFLGGCLIVMAIAFYVIYAKQLINQNISMNESMINYNHFENDIGKLLNIGELEFNTINVGMVYDNLSFVTIDGEMYRMSDVSLNEENYDFNMKYIRDMMEEKTLYVVLSGKVDENGIPYCYLYSSEPTKQDTLETSLNAYLLTRGFCQ